MRRDRAGRVSLIDLGGSTPGITRRYAPSLIFRVEGFAALYVNGYCRRRQENRTPYIDRIDRLTA